MAAFNDSDEEFVQKFVGLSTNEKVGPIISIARSGTTSTDWGMCLLARVVYDRTTMDKSFQSAMVKAWKADPNTLFRQVMRNCYLVQFMNDEDKQLASQGGP